MGGFARMPGRYFDDVHYGLGVVYIGAFWRKMEDGPVIYTLGMAMVM